MSQLYCTALKKFVFLFLGVNLLLLTTVHAKMTQNLYPFDTPKQTAQFNHLLKELRCLVCQNQDLSDSYAPLAKDLRQQIYERVQKGESDSEIITYLTQRYGDFILFNPPMKSVTFILWVAPGVFLLLGAIIFYLSTRRRGQHG